MKIVGIGNKQKIIKIEKQITPEEIMNKLKLDYIKDDEVYNEKARFKVTISFTISEYKEWIRRGQTEWLKKSLKRKKRRKKDEITCTESGIGEIQS